MDQLQLNNRQNWCNKTLLSKNIYPSKYPKQRTLATAIWSTYKHIRTRFNLLNHKIQNVFIQFNSVTKQYILFDYFTSH